MTKGSEPFVPCRRDQCLKNNTILAVYGTVRSRMMDALHTTESS